MQSSWVAPAALVIALIAVAVAIWALVSAPGTNSEEAKSATAEQSEAAKAQACATFDDVRRAVFIQTNQDLGPDPVARKAVAADARLATLGGGQYLLSRIDPATPPELAESIRSFANNLQEIGMRQLAGVPNDDPTQSSLLIDTDNASKHVAEMCK